MKYNYILSVQDNETGEQVCQVEAFSQESLQEQLRKVDSAIEDYEKENSKTECVECENPHEPEITCLEAAAYRGNV